MTLTEVLIDDTVDRAWVIAPQTEESADTHPDHFPLYTSDPADEEDSGNPRGPRHI